MKFTVIPIYIHIYYIHIDNVGESYIHIDNVGESYFEKTIADMAN